MVEVNCETDFVAKNEDFVQFARNIAMHIAATNPVSISQDDVPREVVEKEMEIYRDQVRALGKPEQMIDKIAEGKLGKFYKESCLLNQGYVRDPNVTISDLIHEQIAKIGENITIKRFVRFQVGE
jgi:elongation factor Ts